MSENKDIKTALPKLRFPEFVNNKEWIQMQLSTVSNVNMGQSPSSDSYNSVCEGLPLVQGNADIVDRRTKPARYTNSPKKIAHKGDLIMTVRAPVGTISIAETDVCIGRGVCSISAKSNTSQIFIYQYLINLENKWDNIARVGIFASINGEDVKKLQVFFSTNYQEQTKIAECLSSLDDAISGVSDKIEALKEYKKGLMQQLFPAEGKTTPAFRFPEFKNSGEWESHSIKSICSSYSGGTPSTTEPKYYGGTIPFIRSAEINKETTELFLTEEGLLSSSAKLVEKGSVLVALYGANSGDVAISKINGAINQAILCLKSKWNNAFICYYLTLKKNWIINTYIQGGQGNLSGEIIKSVSLLFPKPEEQQRIATILLALDNIIEIQTNQLEQLKVHKKGLMQQLFPNLNN